MASTDVSVKVGPWGGCHGTPRDISGSSKPQRLESITIWSSEYQGGRIYGLSFEYLDEKQQTIAVGPFGSTAKGNKETIRMCDGEYVNHVSGTVDMTGVTSLQFETSSEIVYGPYGCQSKSQFSLPLDQDDGKVVAFFGRSSDSLIALGVYVLTGNKISAVKVGPWGGCEGTATYRDILQSNVPRRLQSITIRSSEGNAGRVYGLSFVYVDQNGQSISVGPWGSTTKGSPNTLTMSHKEYVNHVSGTADDKGVTSLSIETTTKAKHGPYGCPTSTGTTFSLPMQQGNGAAVSFFGLSNGDNIVKLGTYLGSRADT